MKKEKVTFSILTLLLASCPTTGPIGHLFLGKAPAETETRRHALRSALAERKSDVERFSGRRQHAASVAGHTGMHQTAILFGETLRWRVAGVKTARILQAECWGM